MDTTRTSSGLVAGVTLDGYTRYLGIPYAQPPLGALRFKPPVPVVPWENVRQCDKWPKSPIQAPYNGNNQDEDCLALNIWVPDSTEDKLPIMIWVHGGSYATGSTTNAHNSGDGQLYDMGTMAKDTGCILVSVNYRLNVLGFLDLTEVSDTFTANNGIRDVVLALRWIHCNAEAFHGDKNNITVFGQSAGGALALSLLCIPDAKPYFHKIIAQSSGVIGFMNKHEGVRRGREWLERLGNPDAEQLASMDPSVLVSCNKELSDAFSSKSLDCFFAPVVDGTYLVDLPNHAILSQCDKALMIGWARRETSLFFAGVKDKQIFRSQSSLSVALPYHSEDARERIASSIPGFPSKETYIQISTERMYAVPSLQVASNLCQSSDVFVYRMDYAPRILRILQLGPCHIVELPLLFDNPIRLGKLSLTALDKKTARAVGKRLRQYWGNFAKTGTPHVDWIAYDVQKQNTQIITAHKDYMEESPLRGRERLY